MHLVVIGWLYVALMMSVAEATHSKGTVLGAVITFVLYGVGPVALVVYLLATPARKKAIRARENKAATPVQPVQPVQPDSAQPDAGSEAAADAVAPVRKEP